MKRFWTTAAVAALCAFGTGAWAAPQTQYLQLVASTSSEAPATHHHHARKKPAAKTSHGRRTRRAGKEEPSLRGGHARHRAEESRSEAHGRRGRHHAAETETSHSRSRHHRGETVSETRRGRHRAAEEVVTERSERGRHARRRETFHSEIHTEGGATVKVGRHDTLESISRRTGVPVSELARLNRLRRPYHVRLGAHLKLPARRYYVVKSGDTLYSIGRKFGVGPSELAEANGVSAARHIRSGQKIYLPAGAVEAAPREEVAEAERPARRPRAPLFTEPFAGPPAQPTPAPSAPPPQAAAPAPQVAIPQGPSPYQPTPQAQPPSSQGAQLTPPPRATPYQQPPTPPPGETRPLVQSSPPPSASDIAAAGRGKFVWPVQGQVISGFGHKPDGTSNDGLNISANMGDPVRAAADGEVVYAGDQVPSFGNLVLIKHPGGWVTAYAHMGRILVKNRDTVVQGQEIGTAGQTGGVDRPQVHFEIRYAPSPKDKATPVDPALLLPQR